MCSKLVKIGGQFYKGINFGQFTAKIINKIKFRHLILGALASIEQW